MPPLANPQLFTLGAAVKAIRECRGLTQAELAALIGVSLPHMAGIEHAGRQPSEAVLARLSAALAVPTHAISVNLATLPSLEPQP